MSTTDRIREDIAAAGGLGNTSALARAFDVSHERARQLVARDDFPEPLAYVGGRPVWLLADALEWRARTAPTRRTRPLAD